MITNLPLDNIIVDHWKAKRVKTIIVAIEELTELQKELCKILRGEELTDHVLEELTDVATMLQALQIIFKIDDSDIKCVGAWKRKRTIERILRGEE